MRKEKTTEERWNDFVKQDFPFFKEIYSSEDEMLSYGLKFQQIYGSYQKAFYEFYSISHFYRSIRLLLKSEDLVEKKGFHERFLEYQYKKNEDILSLIMMISLIEKLSSQKDYLSFSEWIEQKNLENGKVLEAWNKYNEEFGCSHKFRNFFTSQQYLSKKEKLHLLRSIQYFVESENGSKQTVPLFCYDKARCGKRQHGCQFDSYDCSAFNDEKIIKIALKEFANFLYELRNRFVHNAHMFMLSEEYAEYSGQSALADYIDYRFRYIKRPNFKNQVIITLSALHLKGILDANFKKLLDSYIAANMK
jgi:hypothetical protein